MPRVPPPTPSTVTSLPTSPFSMANTTVLRYSQLLCLVPWFKTGFFREHSFPAAPCNRRVIFSGPHPSGAGDGLSIPLGRGSTPPCCFCSWGSFCLLPLQLACLPPNSPSGFLAAPLILRLLGTGTHSPLPHAVILNGVSHPIPWTPHWPQPQKSSLKPYYSLNCFQT